MDIPTLNKALSILRKAIQKWKVPAVGVIAEGAIDRPFETLMSTILSLRTKDAVTEAASHRLLARAPTPEILASLSDPGNRATDISGRLLPHKGETPDRDLPVPSQQLRRQRSPFDGRTTEASRRRPENGESRAYGRFRRLWDLRGYARASHFKPLGICPHKDA